MASGFKVANAYVSLTLDRDPLRNDIAGLPAQLNNDVDRAGRDVGKRLGKGIGDGADGRTVGKLVGDDVDRALQPRAEQSGRDSGDKLSRGMEMAVTRNSPLIVAAISGGLIAGAPALLGAAGVLFAGMAAVAVHSNAQIQSAFAGTKDTITSTFTSAAQVTVPFFVGALGRIGSAVKALGPQLRDAFSALGGPVDSLTTGLIALMNNVMPGLVAAVKAAGPVFQGIASMLGSIGTGLGQMFQILSEHSGAAGQVFSQLGQIIGSLLPILGQLLGAGVELASRVLPPVVAVLHAVASALGAIAPALPAVLAGFLGFKAVSFLPGILEKFGSAGVAASGALTGLGKGLPALGVAVGIVGAAFEAQSQQIDKWGRALLDGGNAAAQARAELGKWKQVTDTLNSGVQGFIGHLTGYGTALDVTSQNTKKAEQAARDYYNSLSPLGQAQQDATKAQNDYLAAVQKWGANSGQAVGASVAYRDAQQHVKDVEDQLSQAIHGVTQAMIDQANEALAAANSTFAYQQDVLATKDAEAALKDTIKQHGVNSEETQKATIALGQALLQQAQAAGQLAADQSGLTDKTDLTRISQQATLAELLKLKAQYGSEFPAALQQTIDRLQAAGVKLDQVGAKKPTPTVNMNDAPFNSIYNWVNASIASLGGKRPTPTAFLNNQPFGGAAASMNAMLNYLQSRHITPSASLIAYTLAAERAIDYAARDRYSRIITYVSTFHTGAAATGGKVADVIGLAGKRFDGGGKIRGPGGPTDDLVPAMTMSGVPLRVSNDEWVIKGSSSAKYGDYKMAAINDGRAVVTVPQRGLAGGGPAGTSQSASGERPIMLNVSFPGMIGAPNPADLRRAAVILRDEIRKVERAAR